MVAKADANGLSWASAFATIQKGIHSSVSGDIVEVNQGTYRETVDFNGVGCILSGTDPNDWDVVANTIIDARGDSNGVIFDSNENGNSVLTGLMVTGASSGVYCRYASPTISKCIIRNNKSSGIYCYDGAPIIINNKIYNNGNYDIYLFRNVTGTIIRNNLIHDANYGIFLVSPKAAATITNNTIVHNAKRGIYMPIGSYAPTITNCIIWNCNDDLSGCSATYSCIQDGDAGTGNIHSDPRFVNPDHNDFHIYFHSPCINAGGPNGSYSSQTDIDGGSRVLLDRVDIGADEFSGYLLYGMKVESVSGDANKVTITTTGATYVLTRTGMDMYRRVSPKTNNYDDSNNGRGRKVAKLAFASDIGDLSIEVNEEVMARVGSTKATFQFLSDSFFIVTAKDAFTYTHTNLIANAPWNAPLDPNKRGLDRMWTDGYGGSLHTVMSRPNAPAIGPNDVDSTTINMSAGSIMAHMVYPPKTFDFEGLYGQNAKPFVRWISDKSPLDAFLSGKQNIDGDINDGFGTFLIWGTMYACGNSGYYWAPSILDSGILGYEVNDTWDPCVRAFVDLAHRKGCNVIAYLHVPSQWIYPAGHLLAGQKQSLSVTLGWMREFQAEYGFDGWYFDNADAGDVVEDYDFIRQVRTDIGEDGVIYHHDSVDIWDCDSTKWLPKYSGLRAVFVDTYVNDTLTGETGDIAEVDEPNDPYFRFFTSGYGLSQAYGSHKRISNGRAAISISEMNRLLGENLNCWARTGDSNWRNYFKPAYDARKAQYINNQNHFVCDVNWPIDATAGWFRYPTDVHCQFVDSNVVITWETGVNADSEVAYTNNGAWWYTGYSWAPSGPNGTVYNSNKVTNHTITLTGLDPCTFYEFRIRSSNKAQKGGEIIWGYVGSFTIPPLPDSHRWKLDEQSGTIAHDSVGSNDGNFNGDDPCWVAGFIGGAIDCNGVSDYVSVSALNGAYDYNCSFTVAGWFKTSQSTGIQTIVGNWSNSKPNQYTPNTYYGWQVLVENNKVVARFGYSTEIQNITGARGINDGKWHHFALVYPKYEGPLSSSTVVLYVDGQQNGTPGIKYFFLSNTKFSIGDGSYVSSGTPVLRGGPFRGTIDDVMIFNRALTAEEVQLLYESGS
jgi:parallel beta-helix repeat protein